MFVIVTDGAEFGKGYFVGFKNGNARFQSCYDKYAKTYKTRVRAEKELVRVIAGDEDYIQGCVTYSIEKLDIS
jgi:hypothetical protein